MPNGPQRTCLGVYHAHSRVKMGAAEMAEWIAAKSGGCSALDVPVGDRSPARAGRREPHGPGIRGLRPPGPARRRRDRLPAGDPEAARSSSSNSSTGATATARPCSPPTRASRSGAASSATKSWPPRSSTGCSIGAISSTSGATVYRMRRHVELSKALRSLRGAAAEPGHLPCR